MNLTDSLRRTATRALRALPAPRRKPRPERAPELPAPAELGGPLRAFRAAALWALAVLVVTASGAAFSESYRGLLDWADHHWLGGFWAAAFPLQVDVFIVAGEIVLFIAMTDRYGWRDRVSAWLVALLGLAVSIAGNVGHIQAHDLQSRGTAAVPPVAAFGALWLGLGVLKRILRRRQQAAAETAHVAQQAAGRDVIAAALGELRDAIRALAEKPLPEAPAAPDHSFLLGQLTAAVKMLAERSPDVPPAEVPLSAEHAALAAMRATIAAGNPLSQRQLEVRFGLTRTQASKVREAAGLLPELSLNGSGAHG